MKLSSHLFINANKEKYYTHYANTTGKIKLKGQRKEWFGLLPVFCHKENTHCLNSVVLVYHSGHSNILPKSVPSLSAHRVTKITSCFETGRSTVLHRQLSSFLSKTVARPFCVCFPKSKKDERCHESVSCFENVTRWRQQHERFRLPVLLEVDSKEYSDPVVKSTGEEWKKIFPRSSSSF